MSDAGEEQIFEVTKRQLRFDRELCKWLAEIRELRGVSVEKISEWIGATPDKVCAFEGGRYDATQQFYRLYCVAIGVNISYTITPFEPFVGWVETLEGEL